MSVNAVAGCSGAPLPRTVVDEGAPEVFEEQT
jgi:hypothetical protein